jgi:hypothetical protein
LIRTSGAKFWRPKYRFLGKEKLLSIGSYPKVKLSEARDAADGARRNLKNGIDSSSLKKLKNLARIGPDDLSFTAVGTEWFAKKSPAWSEVHERKTWRMLERACFLDYSRRLSMFKWLFSIFKKEKNKKSALSSSPYAAVKVWFDDENAWVQWPEKEPLSLAWSALIGVAVETTDQGPFTEDVWWHLASKEKVVTYPSEASGAGEILTRLQDLPTFNNERLIQAMASMQNNTFILWDHEGRHQ